MSFSVIVLAAGQGTRMNSVQPKVLQLLAGKPLLHHVLGTVQQLAPLQTLVVCGYKGEEVMQSCVQFAAEWVWQTEQRGTGHAVQVAYPALLEDTQRVLVLYGDVPLIQANTLQQFMDNTPADAVGIITADLPQPDGLGRIIRDKQQQIISIIEEKDATDTQRSITEINSGIYLLPYRPLAGYLANLTASNQQLEYYLTDIIAMAARDGLPIVAHKISNHAEIIGVNSQAQLASLERQFQLQQANNLLQQGVKLYDPARFDLRGTLQVGKDVTIDVNVILEGNVEIGDNVYIGPHVTIKNSQIENDAVIHAYSMIDTSVVGIQAEVGPFARLRPGTKLQAQSKIGNFVEVKNSTIGVGSKVNHLSYIGDAELGTKVNIGAGVITCNYDGAMKHKTIIEDEVFVGSNCELIAPVTIGKRATLAAGTTLTKDAPADALTLTKKIMTSIFSWQRPVKTREEQ